MDILWLLLVKMMLQMLGHFFYRAQIGAKALDRSPWGPWLKMLLSFVWG